MAVFARSCFGPQKQVVLSKGFKKVSGLTFYLTFSTEQVKWGEKPCGRLWFAALPLEATLFKKFDFLRGISSLKLLYSHPFLFLYLHF